MGLWDQIKKFAFGRDPKAKQFSTLNAGQSQAEQQFNQNPIQNNSTYQAGNSWLQNILNNDPETMGQFYAPHIRQFNEQTVPGIAERFAGMGTGAGAMSSGAFNQTMAHAATGLQENLASIQANQQAGASQQALQYAQQPYQNQLDYMRTPTQDYYMQEGQQGVIPGAINAAAQGVAQGFGGPLANYTSSMINQWTKGKPKAQVGMGGQAGVGR